MAYVTPSTVTAGTSPITAAAQNILVNNDIAIQKSIVRLAYQTITSDFSVLSTATVASATDVFSTDLT
jgi:hypothetical protein